MKNILIIIFGLFLQSCDDRFNAISDGNSSPILKYLKTDNRESKDSLKTGKNIKYILTPYQVSLSLFDRENKLKSLEISSIGGIGEFKVNSIPTTNSFSVTAGGNVTVSFLPATKSGNYTLTYKLVDQLGAISTLTNNLFVFDNLPPVSKLSVNKNQVNGPYSATLDASLSYDQDRYLGGGIKYYVFNIKDNNGIQSLPPTVNPIREWVFPGVGGYEVSVTVYDDDGAIITSPVLNVSF